MFALQGVGRSIHATGVRHRLMPGRVDGLDAAVCAFFTASASDDGAPLLVGAIPFDDDGAPFVYQPLYVHLPVAFDTCAAPAQLMRLRAVDPEPSPDGYRTMVRAALARIDAGQVEKVVLARCLHAIADRPVDPLALASRLAADRSVTTFLMDLSPYSGKSAHMLVGATPELLIRRDGAQVMSHPLAGSAPRSADAAQDRATAECLLVSDKDRREHALVVDYILDLLSPFCATLHAPERPQLCSTATMWHLGTPIRGTLKHGDGPTAAGLAALLHPTPAVGGVPRAAAVDLIGQLEPQGRGFYAGSIGWTDKRGDGEWFVTLRCAEIRGTSVRLHAGAGIVAGSDPQEELDETAAKFGAMLRAMGLGEIEDRERERACQAR